MSSTNKTSLGLNMWEASDKPVRQDFVNDNTIIDEKITQLSSNLDNVNGKLDNVNSNLGNGRYSNDLMETQSKTALLYWDPNTLNTPYKHGMTLYAEGLAIVTGAYDSYQTVFAIPRGSMTIYTHTTNNGVPSGWRNFDIGNSSPLKITDIPNNEPNHILSFGYYVDGGKVHINVYIDGVAYGQIQPI